VIREPSEAFDGAHDGGLLGGSTFLQHAMALSSRLVVAQSCDGKGPPAKGRRRSVFGNLVVGGCALMAQVAR
jgi:hypothetical protein